MTEKIATTKGTPNQSWLDKHGLDHNSKPQDFYGAFVPELLVETWTTYTNNKAILENANQEGKLYPDWKLFKVSELQQYIRLIIFHGFSPLPQVEYIFSAKPNIWSIQTTSSVVILDQM